MFSCCYRSIGEKFAESTSHLHDNFKRVVRALNSISHREIFWPINQMKVVIKEKFRRIGRIPNVIGAIDGCHIKIEAPRIHSECYRTGKKVYALQLQAVCTPDLIFTDCFTGYPGSVHDSRVLRNSPLNDDAHMLFEEEKFIIGDKAYYPVKTWCIPPYKNEGRLTEGQKRFNKELSKMRQVIERAFALLKGRFRRLKFLPIVSPEQMFYTIMACCVLHNICLRQELNNEDFINLLINEGRESEEQQVSSEAIAGAGSDDQVGLRKRDYLASLF